MKYAGTSAVGRVSDDLIRGAGEQMAYAIVTIGGERVTVCDEAIVAYSDTGESVGIATISPEGEDQRGRPEVVGVFVLPEYQRTGIGKELLLRALHRCAKRDFAVVRMTAVTKRGKRLIDRLPVDLPVVIEVTDQSHLSLF